MSVLNKVPEWKASLSQNPLPQPHSVTGDWVARDRPALGAGDSELSRAGAVLGVGSPAFSGQRWCYFGWRTGEAGQIPLELKYGISILI